MKRIVHFIMILALALGQACEGPEGPEGPPGPEGPQGPAGPAGETTRPIVFELNGFNFTSENDSLGLNLAGLADFGITLAESDLFLVYRAHKVKDQGQIVALPIWSPLPHTLLLTQGILIYDYFFINELEFLMISLKRNFNFNAFSLDETQLYLTNQVFRFIYIPGDFLDNGRIAKPQINLDNYEEVMKHYNLSEKDVQRIKL